METKEKTIEVDSIVRSTNTVINIQMTVDTDKLIRDFKDKPRGGQSNPTQIGSGYQYLVVSNNKAVTGQGTLNIEFNAKVLDSVAFYATSESNNLDHPLFIYDIKKISGSSVFDDFMWKSFTKKGIQPNVKDVTKTTWVDTKFWFFKGDINAYGTEKFDICFAVYWVPEGKTAPELFGCFRQDPTINVSEY